MKTEYIVLGALAIGFGYLWYTRRPTTVVVQAPAQAPEPEPPLEPDVIFDEEPDVPTYYPPSQQPQPTYYPPSQQAPAPAPIPAAVTPAEPTEPTPIQPTTGGSKDPATSPFSAAYSTNLKVTK